MADDAIAEGGDDDWMDGGAAGVDAGDAADWAADLGAEDGLATVEDALTAAPEDSGPAEAAPKEAQDPSRAKHIARQKKREAELEREADLRAMADQGTPLDDPVAEKERLRKLQEKREMEIAAETFGLAGDDGAAAAGGDADEDADDGDAGEAAGGSGAAAAASAAATGAGAAAPAADMPVKMEDWVAQMPIKGGKAWNDLGGMMVDRAVGEKSSIFVGKFVKGVLRAAVTEEVLTKEDVAALKAMVEDAVTNLAIAKERSDQGRGKKKKGAKGKNLASKRGAGKSGYTAVQSDADIMGSMAGGSASGAVARMTDDDDFM